MDQGRQVCCSHDPERSLPHIYIYVYMYVGTNYIAIRNKISHIQVTWIKACENYWANFQNYREILRQNDLFTTCFHWKLTRDIMALKFTRFWRLQGLQWLVLKARFKPLPFTKWPLRLWTPHLVTLRRFAICRSSWRQVYWSSITVVLGWSPHMPYTSSHNHGSQKWVLPVIVVIYLSNIAIFHFHDNGRKSNAKQCKTYLCRTLRVVHVYFGMADFWSQKTFWGRFLTFQELGCRAHWSNMLMVNTMMELSDVTGCVQLKSIGNWKDSKGEFCTQWFWGFDLSPPSCTYLPIQYKLK